MNPYVIDLLYAKLIGKAVDVRLATGQHYPYAGVKDVCEAENWFALWNPQVFGDNTTFRRLPLSLNCDLSITDVDYGQAA
ncbi:MAG: hypothetical protein QOE09_380 [Ilumatobacteraceae bacterium]|jgi:hypothetical protein